MSLCFPAISMDVFSSVSHISAVRFSTSRLVITPHATSSLPFPKYKAKYYTELEAAVDIVERACSLCVDVKSSLFSSDGRILEKNDQTPVTVADFGVQALVSLELGKLFPTIPLVAEEDSAFLLSNNLVDSVMNAVTEKISHTNEMLTEDDVLEAIDRGGPDAFTFCTSPATYWVLDPIDGTRGFLKGSEALYVLLFNLVLLAKRAYSSVYIFYYKQKEPSLCQILKKFATFLWVGLALVVEGEIVLGVMGCPNWSDALSNKSRVKFQEPDHIPNGLGSIMIAHIGCGTWTKKSRSSVLWTRCYVDACCTIQSAQFCIPDSQTWESLPLSASFNPTNDANSAQDDQIYLLSTCCGSLCKYFMVASGRASVFILRAKVTTTMKTWDHAVGIICVHEAGGKVTDWEGIEIDLAADQARRRIIFPSGGVLVTNVTYCNHKYIGKLSCK